jgi:hypothetical protein
MYPKQHKPSRLFYCLIFSLACMSFCLVYLAIHPPSPRPTYPTELNKNNVVESANQGQTIRSNIFDYLHKSKKGLTPLLILIFSYLFWFVLWCLTLRAISYFFIKKWTLQQQEQLNISLSLVQTDIHKIELIPACLEADNSSKNQTILTILRQVKTTLMQKTVSLRKGILQKARYSNTVLNKVLKRPFQISISLSKIAFRVFRKNTEEKEEASTAIAYELHWLDILSVLNFGATFFVSPFLFYENDAARIFLLLFAFFIVPSLIHLHVLFLASYFMFLLFAAIYSLAGKISYYPNSILQNEHFGLYILVSIGCILLLLWHNKKK